MAKKVPANAATPLPLTDSTVVYGAHFDPRKGTPKAPVGGYTVSFEYPAHSEPVWDAGGKRQFKPVPASYGGFIITDLAEDLPFVLGSKLRNVIVRDHHGIHITLAELQEKMRERKAARRADLLTGALSWTQAIRELLPITHVQGDVATVSVSKTLEERFWSTLEEDEAVGKPMNVATLYHGTSLEAMQSILTSGFTLGNAHCAFGSGIYLGKPDKASGYVKPKELKSRREQEEEAQKYHGRWWRKNGSYASGRFRAVESEAFLLEVDVNLGRVFSSRNDWVYGRLVEGSDTLSCGCPRSERLHSTTWQHNCLARRKRLDAVLGHRNKNKLVKELLRTEGCDTIHYDGFVRPEWVIYDPRRVVVRKVIRVGKR